jgi:hypothetical protein
VNDKGNKERNNMESKTTKGILIANITFLLTVAVAIGFYWKELSINTKAVEENNRAIAAVDGKANTLGIQMNKRVTDISEAGIKRDNDNEKSVVAIDGRLGRIEDKLDVLVADMKDIKKIVLKPIAKASVIDTNAIPEYLTGIMDLK